MFFYTQECIKTVDIQRDSGLLRGAHTTRKLAIFYGKVRIWKNNFRQRKSPQTLIYQGFPDFFWQGQKDLVSPVGSVGASASQRSPPETRAPRHAPHASDTKRICYTKRKRPPYGDRFFLAGAEGLEPSARGF